MIYVELYYYHLTMNYYNSLKGRYSHESYLLKIKKKTRNFKNERKFPLKINNDSNWKYYNNNNCFYNNKE